MHVHAQRFELLPSAKFRQIDNEGAPNDVAT